jgi:hypothetical protein
MGETAAFLHAYTHTVKCVCLHQIREVRPLIHFEFFFLVCVRHVNSQKLESGPFWNYCDTP